MSVNTEVSETRRPLIDACASVLVKPSRRFPREVTPLLPPKMEAPVEELLSIMDAHSIEKAVLYQQGGSEIEHHGYLISCLEKFPQTFAGIGLLPESYENIARHMDSLLGAGVVGFLLSQLGGAVDPFADVDVSRCASFPVWSEAASRNAILSLDIQAAEAHLIPYFLDAFPTVNVVVGRAMVFRGPGEPIIDEHGRPRFCVQLPAATKFTASGLNSYENLYVTLAGYFSFSSQPWPFEDVNRWHQPPSMLETFGHQRVMWGGDFPWIRQTPGFTRNLEFIRYRLQYISERSFNSVMHKTAYELFGFGKD